LLQTSALSCYTAISCCLGQEQQSIEKNCCLSYVFFLSCTRVVRTKVNSGKFIILELVKRIAIAEE